MGANTYNHLGCQNSNLKLRLQQKDSHEGTHTMNEHTWGCKTLWINTTLAKKLIIFLKR